MREVKRRCKSRKNLITKKSERKREMSFKSRKGKK